MQNRKAIASQISTTLEESGQSTTTHDAVRLLLFSHALIFQFTQVYTEVVLTYQGGDVLRVGAWPSRPPLRRRDRIGPHN